MRLYPTLVRFDTMYVQYGLVQPGNIATQLPCIEHLPDRPVELLAGGWIHADNEILRYKENCTRSHDDINPKYITSMSPFPDIEEGLEPDFRKLKAGGVKMEAVLRTLYKRA